MATRFDLALGIIAQAWRDNAFDLVEMSGKDEPPTLDPIHAALDHLVEVMDARREDAPPIGVGQGSPASGTGLERPEVAATIERSRRGEPGDYAGNGSGGTPAD